MIEFVGNELVGFYVKINGKDGGQLLLDDAGFYNWFPPNIIAGYIPSWILKSLYDKLEELNADINAEMQALAAEEAADTKTPFVLDCY